MKKNKRISRTIKIFLLILFFIVIAIEILLNYTTPVTDNLDNFVYELPFKKGDKYKVIQGYGGLFTHSHSAALDFGMPVGTPVYAARGGIVYRFRSNSDEGGLFRKYKNKANYIIIKHDDGSFGCYWHLQKDGVLVKSGRVATGQQIGISGATGQVLKPHLHFSVKRKLSYQMNSFVRTKFRTTEGIVILKNKRTYERPED